MYVVKMDKKVVDQGLELQIMVFIIVYLLTMLVTTLLLAAMGIDGVTSLTASIATIGNVGPGFGGVSSLDNYADMPAAAKYILSVNMLLGRLEIMNIFALFLLLFRKS
jgi:trk system potassium uptake protein TrkH